MEYDNDRAIKGTYPAEVGCWIFIGLLHPLADGLAVFPHRPGAWWVLLLASVLLLPAYIFFARVIVPKYAFTHRYFALTGWSMCWILIVVTLTFLLYGFGRSMFAGPSRIYFVNNNSSVLRESVWSLMMLLFAYAVAWMRAALEEKDAKAKLQKENLYYKLRYFRTQLNPHFLFNTLNSIYSLSLAKTDKTPEVVVRLADIMRFLIYECNEDRIPLQKEIEFIRNYIEIERIRYDADIQFTIEGETEGVMIEPFLFISFIENGFKHAIDNSFAKPFIYITLKVGAAQIALNVINNTSLELETQAKKVKGKGLETSKSVLELLYPDAYALDIIQTEKGARKESKQRLKNAQERLERLYPDKHTLDVILNNNTFTVSLVLITGLLDKMYHHRR